MIAPGAAHPATRIVADDAAASDPRRDTACIATVDGRRMGCTFLGLGTRLDDECPRIAAGTGYEPRLR
jgi:hypothetical protein